MGTVLIVLKLFFIIFLEIVCFLSCRYIVYERYLAAKTGTNSVVFELMGSCFQMIYFSVAFVLLFVSNELSSGRDD
jgi:hypothetical protein